MNFSLTEEQKMVVDSAAKFSRVLRERQRLTEKEGVSDDLWRTYAELGLKELDWPQKWGGSGLGRLTKLLALEQLAFGDGAAAMALDRTSWVCSPLLALDRVGDRVHQTLQKAAEGFAPAFYVDADEQLIVEGNQISGHIAYLPAKACDGLFVLKGTRLFYLSTGIALTPTLAGALDAMGASRGEIKGTAEWAETLTEPEALRLKGLWRLPLAALLAGLSRAAFDHARVFCVDRVTFGKKVAHHQAVAFIFADMATSIDAAWLLSQRAALEVDQGKDAAGDLHHAFLQAAECGQFVTTYGVQLLGSAGYVRDHPVEKWMREAQALSLLAAGTDGAQVDANRALALSLEAA